MDVFTASPGTTALPDAFTEVAVTTG